MQIYKILYKIVTIKYGTRCLDMLNVLEKVFIFIIAILVAFFVLLMALNAIEKQNDNDAVNIIIHKDEIKDLISKQPTKKVIS